MMHGLRCPGPRRTAPVLCASLTNPYAPPFTPPFNPLSSVCRHSCAIATHAIKGSSVCTAQCDTGQCCSDVGAGKGVFDDTCYVACPAGTYSGSFDVSCILCQAGTYSSAVEASQPSTCQA